MRNYIWGRCSLKILLIFYLSLSSLSRSLSLSLSSRSRCLSLSLSLWSLSRSLSFLSLSLAYCGSKKKVNRPVAAWPAFQKTIQTKCHNKNKRKRFLPKEKTDNLDLQWDKLRRQTIFLIDVSIVSYGVCYCRGPKLCWPIMLLVVPITVYISPSWGCSGFSIGVT